jgi:hypothetical protein
LKESRIFGLELGGRTVGVLQIRLHDLLHDEAVDFIAFSLFVGDVIESKTDMGIVQADFLVKAQVEDVKIDAEWNFY